MAIYEFFSDIMMGSLTRGFGEQIDIISTDGSQTHRTYGIYEDSYFSLREGGEVPVLVDSPSFIIRNLDISRFTDEYPLYRKNWKIKRLSPDITYLITNYDRDEVTSVRYILTQEEPC